MPATAIDDTWCSVASSRRASVDHRPGALDVGGALVVLGGGDVVDGGAVHDVVDGAELGDGLVGEPEIGRGEVADQRLSPGRPTGRLGASRSNRASDSAADQDPDLGVVGLRSRISRHHSAADKPGTAGNDIAHASHGHLWPAKVNAV